MQTSIIAHSGTGKGDCTSTQITCTICFLPVINYPARWNLFLWQRRCPICFFPREQSPTENLCAANARSVSDSLFFVRWRRLHICIPVGPICAAVDWYCILCLWVQDSADAAAVAAAANAVAADTDDCDGRLRRTVQHLISAKLLLRIDRKQRWPSTKPSSICSPVQWCMASASRDTISAEQDLTVRFSW